MTMNTDGHHEETVQIELQSMKMRLLIRRVTMLTIVVLALLAGSGISRAQNDERRDTATDSTPNGFQQSQANVLRDEISKLLRAYYDAWTKLDAAALNSNVADDGFVTQDGEVLTTGVFKSRVHADFASTSPNDNYQFEFEDLRLFQSTADTAIANYRLVSTPANKNLSKQTNNITDMLVRRDGRWLIFAENASDIPMPVEPVVSGLPSSWKRMSGGKADHYLIYVDSEIKHGGKASASIKFNCGGDQYPWASLGQSIAADEYRGNRVRLSGWLKTVNAGAASFWMRIDGEQRQLGFDNMSGRAVSGTTDWKMYSVVLDVPNDAKNIFLGVLLIGKGQTWADDLMFEVVDRNIVVTNKGTAQGADDPAFAKIPKATIKRPINLGFEEGRVP